MQISADVLPSLLDLDLFENGVGDSMSPFPGMSADQFAAYALRQSLLKKFHNDETNAVADEAALLGFFESNLLCNQFQLPPLTEVEAIAHGEGLKEVYNFFYPSWSPFGILDWDSIIVNSRPGPGATIGTRDHCFLSKMAHSTMDASDPLLPILYRQALRNNHHLDFLVESKRAELYGDKVASSSRLSFVPKNRDISRCICTEPLLNMLFQQGIGTILTKRLRSFFNIDLRTQQDVNRRLAQVGSKSGSFGTIDLKSASDSISLGLFKTLIPKDQQPFFLRTRTGVTTLPGGENLDLHMVSSMGNAFTFPLQTAIFASLARACCNTLSIPANIAVFGDDIIVPREAYDLTTRMLSIWGFRVNTSKSFNTGLFRESCGRDFFCGRDVRGVYLQTLLTDSDVYSAVNRLVRWSAKHGILLRRVVSYLLSFVKRNFVPYDESDDAGIKVPLSVTGLSYPLNSGIRYLAKVQSDASHPVHKLPPSHFIWSNPDGVWQAAAAGYLRGGRVLFRRTRRMRSHLRRRMTPRWDHVPPEPFFDGFPGAWKSTAAIMLDF